MIDLCEYLYKSVQDVQDELRIARIMALAVEKDTRAEFGRIAMSCAKDDHFMELFTKEADAYAQMISSKNYEQCGSYANQLVVYAKAQCPPKENQGEGGEWESSMDAAMLTLTTVDAVVTGAMSAQEVMSIYKQNREGTEGWEEVHCNHLEWMEHHLTRKARVAMAYIMYVHQAAEIPFEEWWWVGNWVSPVPKSSKVWDSLKKRQHSHAFETPGGAERVDVAEEGGENGAAKQASPPSEDAKRVDGDSKQVDIPSAANGDQGVEEEIS